METHSGNICTTESQRYHIVPAREAQDIVSRLCVQGYCNTRSFVPGFLTHFVGSGRRKCGFCTVSEADKLVALLWRERISQAHLMPTYDSVTAALRSRWRLEESIKTPVTKG